MNIVIEGCDCVGKSTLAKQIVAINSAYHAYHEGPPPKGLTPREAYAHQRARNKELVEFSHAHDFTVFDRFIFSEAVYGPLMRKTRYPKYLRNYEQNLVLHSTLVVFIWADPREIARHFDGKFVKVDQLAVINEEFKREFYRVRVDNKVLLQQRYDGHLIDQLRPHFCLPQEGG